MCCCNNFQKQKIPILEQLGVEPKTYALLTTHRPENVDNLENLKNIVEAVIRLNSLTIIFPAHPRTQKQLRKTRLYSKILKQKHIKLIKNAKLILTDSGGMQKEAFWLKTPCMTLRETTEWPETVKIGANRLTGTNPQKIIENAMEILEKEMEITEKLKDSPNPFWNGNASQKNTRYNQIFSQTSAR
jgi:UDP-N-acetylglucosamine 2-epimerase (non-hydrolysing)